MTVATILRQKGSEIVTISSDKTLNQVTQLLSENGIGALVVADSDMRIEGIISERDVVNAIGKSGASCLENPVSDYMTKNVVTCVEEDSHIQLMETMTKGKFRHMPVTKNGILIGVVSIGDVVKRRIAEAELEAQSMRDYIATG